MSAVTSEVPGMEELRQRLREDGREVPVNIVLPQETAEKILRLLELEATTGAQVLSTKGEFTTTEAAQHLGMSRSKLMYLIRSGEIPAHKVGVHHRISVDELFAYRLHQKAFHDKGLEEISNYAMSTDDGTYV